MYSIGEFAALISEKQNWRKLIMKNLMRMLTVALILAGTTLANAAENSPSGPGPEPAPPVGVNF
jgi:hypothetical protein